MVVNAVMLLNADYKKLDYIQKKLEMIREVKLFFTCFGRYDVVAFLEAESYEKIKNVSSEISGTYGCLGSETLIEG